MSTFVALDFETADRYRDSACSIGLVRVENNKLVKKVSYFIRPPRERFEFTRVHGITWKDVAKEPSFAELWPTIESLIKDVDFLAAHNASFDRSVLNACCRENGISQPISEFICTVKLARDKWNIRPTKLPNVCKHLGIPLKHHDALSDAEACALIVVAANQY
jgi:DNA polymerase-3 subunit epsilon